MADVLIVQPDGQARSLLKRVLEEDGYQVACVADLAAALAPLYLNPCPLVVIVDDVGALVGNATLDLIVADLGPLGRHRYIMLAESARDEALWAAASPLALLHCAVVRKPVTPAQVRKLVARYVPRLPTLSLNWAELDAIAR